MKSLFASVLSLSLALLASGANAQATTNQPGTLQIRTGTAMTVVENEYRNARSGQTVYTGDSLMVGDDSVSVVVFANGCKREFRGPAVHVVSATDCRADNAAAAVNLTSASTAAMVIAGAGLAGAAILEGMNEEPAPLSAGPNGAL